VPDWFADEAFFVPARFRGTKTTLLGRSTGAHARRFAEGPGAPSRAPERPSQWQRSGNEPTPSRESGLSRRHRLRPHRRSRRSPRRRRAGLPQGRVSPTFRQVRPTGRPTPAGPAHRRSALSTLILQVDPSGTSYPASYPASGAPSDSACRASLASPFRCCVTLRTPSPRAPPRPPVHRFARLPPYCTATCSRHRSECRRPARRVPESVS
jgi:hypothetical protein